MGSYFSFSLGRGRLEMRLPLIVGFCKQLPMAVYFHLALGSKCQACEKENVLKLLRESAKSFILSTIYVLCGFVEFSHWVVLLWQFVAAAT